MALPVIDSAYLSEVIPTTALTALTADADGMVKYGTLYFVFLFKFSAFFSRDNVKLYAT